MKGGCVSCTAHGSVEVMELPESTDGGGGGAEAVKEFLWGVSNINKLKWFSESPTILLLGYL